MSAGLQVVPIGCGRIDVDNIHIELHTGGDDGEPDDHGDFASAKI